MKQGFRVAGCDITFDAEPPLTLAQLGQLAECYQGAKPVLDEWARFFGFLNKILSDGQTLYSPAIVDSWERAEGAALGAWSTGETWPTDNSLIGIISRPR